MGVSQHYDIIIAGGGAAGLAAAVTIATKAKGHGLSVAVIDQNTFAGRKLAASGNGRGNLGNTSFWTKPSLPRYYGSFADTATAMVKAYGLENLEQWFISHGIATYDDKVGRIYPVSERARQVSDALYRYASSGGIEFVLQTKITALQKDIDGVLVETNNGKTYHACRLIIALGSPAGKNIGGIDNLAMLRSMGIAVRPFKPALTALEVMWPKPFLQASGTRFKGCATLNGAGGFVKRAQGEFLLTDAGLSGIAAFELSCFDRATQPSDLSLEICFVNSECQLLTAKTKWLNTLKKLSKVTQTTTNAKPSIMLETTLEGALPLPLARAIALTAKGSDIVSLWQTISQSKFVVKGFSDFSKAQVASGGVEAQALEPETPKAKQSHGLYFAGEIIDVIGDTGGYNLQFAFISGIKAAEAVCASLGVCSQLS